MIGWLSAVGVVLLAAVVAAGLGVVLLFAPLRPMPLRVLRRDEWSGAVPYRIVRVGPARILIVRGLPTPSSFDGDSPTRSSISLDGAWQFRLDPDEKGEARDWHRGGDGGASDSWVEVPVPSVFNAAESDLTDYLGVAWYRREFGWPAEGAGDPASDPGRRDGSAVPERPRRTVLCFQGLLLRGRVWLNGELLGAFEGGYTPQRFDLTGRLRGRNLLAVCCDNRLTADSLPPRLKRDHHPGWHTYGGIHRPVALEIQPADSIVTLRMGRAGTTIACEVVTRHSTAAPGEAVSLALALVPAGAAIAPAPAPERWATARRTDWNPREGLARWEAVLPASGLPRWSPGEPARVVVQARLAESGGTIDEVRQTTGLRTVEVSGERLLLNGAPIFLRGICRHEDHPRLGASVTAESIRTDLDLVEALGANHVRRAHYPHAPAELEAAEVRGLLQSEEIPLYQAGTGFSAWKQEREGLLRLPVRLFGLRQMRRPALLAHARRQLIELIERDRHRPSIILWGLGNENYALGRRGGRTIAALAAVAREWDATRPLTYVELTYNIALLDRARRGWDAVDLMSLNAYHGWYYGTVDDLATQLAEIRRRHPGRPLVISEFGAGAQPGRSSADGPWRGDRIQRPRTYGEDDQAELIEGYWRIARAHRWVVGLSPWVLSDFYNIWFPANPTPNYNLKGLTSRDRVPKLAFHRLAALYRAAAGEDHADG